MKTLVRSLFCLTLCLAAAATSSSARKSDWVASYNTLLGKYVTSGGGRNTPNGKRMPATPQAIQAVVDGIAKENVSGHGENSSS